MPRLTISITATGEEVGQDIITLELPPGLTVSDLKSFVQAETNFPITAQHYYYNGTQLRDDTQTLEALGLADGDMLAMMVNRRNTSQAPTPARGQQQQQPAGSGQAAAARRPGDVDAERIEQFRQRLVADPQAMMQLIHTQPGLAQVVNDPQRFFNVWKEMKDREADEQRSRENEIALLNEDPFNADAQKRIEEIIRRERIEQNRQYAYENNPEVFVQVTMLYVDVKVNGIPIKAFVDSGAQSTIMSPSCAERCNIHHLIDERYAGIARGVGTAKILGRVHNAKIEIGDAELDCSFTVMEGRDVDLLFGLDMLRRHQACIDLTTNELRFPHTTVKFLGESDIPKKHEEAMMDEPVVQGPDGTEIGAISGTVRPAGSAAAANSHESQTGGSSAAGPSTTSSTSTGKAQTASTSASSTTATASSGPAASNTSSPYPTASRTTPLISGGSATTQSRQPSAPPAAAAASTTTRQTIPASRSFPEQDIQQIMGIGFSREEAISALRACNGNVEFAASMLFNNM